ncbi:hypothetical protein FAZ95_01200 [Trinickia violacea]|uniref:Uncharacterized protein n=1 Tax=Trinickia violacea TaxID=2571746 RepID=A0A4P8IJS5_9BURK|nr:hypothetical protein [Trinickia violacea]QCP47917.1 hypothetical protein FAZ95_01200 [Trinickia violacea]
METKRHQAPGTPPAETNIAAHGATKSPTSLQKEVDEITAQLLAANASLSGLEVESKEATRKIAEETARADRNARLLSECETSLRRMTEQRDAAEADLHSIEDKLNVGQVQLSVRIEQMKELMSMLDELQTHVDQLAQVSPKTYEHFRNVRFTLGGLLPRANRRPPAQGSMADFDDFVFKVGAIPAEKIRLANKAVVEAMDSLRDSNDLTAASMLGMSDEALQLSRQMNYRDKQQLINSRLPIWQYRFSVVPVSAPSDGRPRELDQRALAASVLASFKDLESLL